MKRKLGIIDSIEEEKSKYLSDGFEKYNMPDIIETADENDAKLIDENTYVTHDAQFHADEVLGIVLLLLSDNFGFSEKKKVIRTRNSKIIEASGICIDVGGVYNPEKGKFDHHQLNCNETFDRKTKIKLSSSGLIYKNYGKIIVENLLSQENGFKKPETLEEIAKYEDLVNTIYNRIYYSFMIAIDAHDNGMSQYDGKKHYDINTNFSLRIRNLNAVEYQKDKSKRCQSFKKALYLALSEFVEHSGNIIRFYVKDEMEVSKAFENRFNTHKSGKVLELTRWISNEIIYEIEDKYNEELSDDEKKKNEILFTIYPSGDSWRLGTVSIRGEYYGNRLSILWAGLNDEELINKSGISGCIFVHKSGFTGGNKTKEGVLEMVTATIGLNYDQIMTLKRNKIKNLEIRGTGEKLYDILRSDKLAEFKKFFNRKNLVSSGYSAHNAINLVLFLFDDFYKFKSQALKFE